MNMTDQENVAFDGTASPFHLSLPAGTFSPSPPASPEATDAAYRPGGLNAGRSKRGTVVQEDTSAQGRTPPTVYAEHRPEEEPPYWSSYADMDPSATALLDDSLALTGGNSSNSSLPHASSYGSLESPLPSTPFPIAPGAAATASADPLVPASQEVTAGTRMSHQIPAFLQKLYKYRFVFLGVSLDA